MLKKISRITGIILAVLFAGLLLLMGVCYGIYYSPVAADLPCRNCSGEAQAVTIGGFDLYYRAVGQPGKNPPVVLLHGGPGMSSQTFKRKFDFLSEGYQVIYYDQRGSGNSQIKPDSSAYTIDQLVEELESLRRDKLKSEQMILVGHSAGGALAQRYAMKYPQRVNKMVLVTALPANGGLAVGGLGMDAVVAVLNVLSGNTPPRDPQQADARFAEIGYQASLSRLFDPAHPELIQDFGYYSFAVNRDLTRSTYGGNFDAQLKQLPFETLILYGAGDRSDFTGETAARQMYSVLPHATLVGFARSGHWPYLEEPERFQQVLREFLSQ
jgi:proline iminopeptidase